MSEHLDIYVLTAERTHASVARFLEAYVDVAASSDRSGEELMMLPVGYQGPVDAAGFEWEWRPIRTLDEAISVGLGGAPRAFALYLTGRKNEPSPILAFTRDGQLVLGLSVPSDDPRAADGGAALLDALMVLCHGVAGFAACEQRPPLDEADFRSAMSGTYVCARAPREAPEP